MLNRLFGNYLVNRGYLEPAQLDNLLESINGYKADPETVILINKFLTLSQIQSIQQSQAQEESFTDAALRLQMLTDIVSRRYYACAFGFSNVSSIYR